MDETLMAAAMIGVKSSIQAASLPGVIAGNLDFVRLRGKMLNDDAQDD
jgi:hypothetical protein